jgi:hypothetical protein
MFTTNYYAVVGQVAVGQVAVGQVSAIPFDLSMGNWKKIIKF